MSLGGLHCAHRASYVPPLRYLPPDSEGKCLWQIRRFRPLANDLDTSAGSALRRTMTPTAFGPFSSSYVVGLLRSCQLFWNRVIKSQTTNLTRRNSILHPRRTCKKKSSLKQIFFMDPPRNSRNQGGVCDVAGAIWDDVGCALLPACTLLKRPTKAVYVLKTAPRP